MSTMSLERRVAILEQKLLALKRQLYLKRNRLGWIRNQPELPQTMTDDQREARRRSQPCDFQQ